MKHFKSKKRIQQIAQGLKVIAGGKHFDNSLDKLATTAWIFLQCALWNCTKFSTKERTVSQDKIKEILCHGKDYRQAFLIFCERVLIAKLSIVKGNGGPSLPSAWLSGNQFRGYGETANAYSQVKTMRESLPHYKYEWKALAESVLEFSEEPSSTNFRYWSDYFTERQASGLLHLFQVFAANYHLTR